MLNWDAIVNLLTMVLLGVGAFALYVLKSGTAEAANELAKLKVQQSEWSTSLAQELQKTRGVERQELRYKSYGALWKHLRPLALYDAAVINKKVVGDLSLELANWYFNVDGGLLLTPQAREFYFALQDLLRTTLKVPEEWDANRSEDPAEAPSVIFLDVLKARSVVLKERGTDKDVLIAGKVDKAICVLKYFKAGAFVDWENKAAHLGEEWKEGIQVIATAWNVLNEEQRFATLQQVGSILRTTLSNDLESRLR